MCRTPNERHHIIRSFFPEIFVSHLQSYVETGLWLAVKYAPVGAIQARVLATTESLFILLLSAIVAHCRLATHTLTIVVTIMTPANTNSIQRSIAMRNTLGGLLLLTSADVLSSSRYFSSVAVLVVSATDEASPSAVVRLPLVVGLSLMEPICLECEYAAWTFGHSASTTRCSSTKDTHVLSIVVARGAD